jgi:hypothetical protein
MDLSNPMLKAFESVLSTQVLDAKHELRLPPRFRDQFMVTEEPMSSPCEGIGMKNCEVYRLSRCH